MEVLWKNGMQYCNKPSLVAQDTQQFTVFLVGLDDDPPLNILVCLFSDGDPCFVCVVFCDGPMICVTVIQMAVIPVEAIGK